MPDELSPRTPIATVNVYVASGDDGPRVEVQGQTQGGPSGPNRGEIDVTLHGLFALVPTEGGYQSVFMSPDDSDHVPLIGILTRDLAEQDHSVPDMVAPWSGGEGLALWRFKGVAFEPGNLVDAAFRCDDSALDAQETDFTKLRWVPAMQDIFGGPRDVDPQMVAGARATGIWKYGTMTALFDAAGHRTDPWTIGDRAHRPVADGVGIRVALQDYRRPASLGIERPDGSRCSVLIRGGATIRITDYPTELPRVGDGMPHFHHFYMMLAGDKMGPNPTRDGARAPAPGVLRCAPSLTP